MLEADGIAEYTNLSTHKPSVLKQNMLRSLAQNYLDVVVKNSRDILQTKPLETQFKLKVSNLSADQVHSPHLGPQN